MIELAGVVASIMAASALAAVAGKAEFVAECRANDRPAAACTCVADQLAATAAGQLLLDLGAQMKASAGRSETDIRADLAALHARHGITPGATPVSARIGNAMDVAVRHCQAQDR